MVGLQRDIVIISLDLTSVLGLIPQFAPTTGSIADTNPDMETCCSVVPSTNGATTSGATTSGVASSGGSASRSSSGINIDLTTTVGGGKHISTSSTL